jgi:ectoine hydroxylase-related dioxygenase (phytanoyl-CoA dioxygenase family)
MTATLTADRDIHIQDLEDHGYCLIEGALTPSEVSQLRERTMELAVQEVEDGTDYIYDNNDANQRVFTLLNKGECFVRIAQHPLAMDFAEHLLGPAFLLSNIDVNIAGPGGSRMVIHNDQLFVPPPWPMPVVMNIAWMLDDFTEENGATRVVPGSHTSTEWPSEDETIPVCAPAGSAMVFEGRLWHQTGANVTGDQQRVGLFTYYCKPWLRTQENWTRSIDDKVLDSATPQLRQLIGFEPYFTLGSIGGLDRTGPRG